MDDEERTRLRAEWKGLALRERFHLSWLAFTGQTADDGRSARMVVLCGRDALKAEIVVLGLWAGTGRAILGSVLLKLLEPIPPARGWHLGNITVVELAEIAGMWAAASGMVLIAERWRRRALRANEPLAMPPIRSMPRSIGTRWLVSVNVLMVIVIVVLCLIERGTSLLWAAYFSAEGLLLLATLLVAIRRKTI